MAFKTKNKVINCKTETIESSNPNFSIHSEIKLKFPIPSKLTSPSPLKIFKSGKNIVKPKPSRNPTIIDKKNATNIL